METAEVVPNRVRKRRVSTARSIVDGSRGMERELEVFAWLCERTSALAERDLGWPAARQSVAINNLVARKAS